MISPGRFARRENAEPSCHLEVVGQTRLCNGRNFGRRCDSALAARDRESAKLPAAYSRQDRYRGAEHERDLARQDGRLRRTPALVGHDSEIDLCHHAKHLQREMRRGAGTGMPGRGAGLCLEKLDELLDVVRRHGRMHDQELGSRRHCADRSELVKLVVHLLDDVRIQGESPSRSRAAACSRRARHWPPPPIRCVFPLPRG